MSRIHTDVNSPIFLSGSYKIMLLPQILEHFRSGNWSAHLIAIYYAKQQGNYQKKEVILGSCRAPLLSAIRDGGLKGDYAFKNSLGMFTCLAKAIISYDKISKGKTTGQLEATSSFSKDNYWILLDFS